MSTRLTTRQSPNLQMLMTYELHQLFFPHFFRPQQFWSLNIVTVGIMNGRDIFERLIACWCSLRVSWPSFISWPWTGDDFMAQVVESLMWRLFTIFSEFAGLLDLAITVARSCDHTAAYYESYMYGHLLPFNSHEYVALSNNYCSIINNFLLNRYGQRWHTVNSPKSCELWTGSCEMTSISATRKPRLKLNTSKQREIVDKPLLSMTLTMFPSLQPHRPQVRNLLEQFSLQPMANILSQAPAKITTPHSSSTGTSSASSATTLYNLSATSTTF